MSFCRWEDERCSPILFLLVSSSLVSSCSGYVHWIYPGAGLTFNYIDTVFFTWTSDITNPWMNLWCAPNSTSPQSKKQAYHTELSSTNGTNPRSFHYSEYYNNGICHMQLENLAEDNYGNTPTFEITSNDAVAPQTWGLSALGSLAGSSGPTATASSSSTASSSASIITIRSQSPSSSSTSSSSIPLSTITPAASTTKAAPNPSASSSPQTLSTVAKAGISIGSIFSGLALVIAVLLFRIARSRRTKGGTKGASGPWTSRRHSLQNAYEIGIGAYYEMSGVARPTELLGMPRAELDWAPRTELSSIPER